MRMILQKTKTLFTKKTRFFFYEEFPLLSSLPSCFIVFYILFFFEPFGLEYLEPFTIKLVSIIIYSSIRYCI